MSKTQSNLNNINETMLQSLKQIVKEKMNIKKDLVAVDNLYGLFLSNNTFIIAKQITIGDEYYTTYKLENFFTKGFIDYAIVDHIEESYLPWEDMGLFSVAKGLQAVAFPVETFLVKYIEKGVTTKRNMTVLFNVINQYIKENPMFINEMFAKRGEKNISKR